MSEEDKRAYLPKRPRPAEEPPSRPVEPDDEPLPF